MSLLVLRAYLAETGGRAMMRGHAVSTSSPRKASVIRFWMVFNRTSSTRSLNLGNLDGREMEHNEQKLDRRAVIFVTPVKLGTSPS